MFDAALQYGHDILRWLDHARDVLRGLEPGVEKDTVSFARRTAVSEGFKYGKARFSKLLNRDGNAPLPPREPSAYAGMNPFALRDTFETGLYLNAAFSYGSRAAVRLGEPVACAHILRPALRDIETYNRIRRQDSDLAANLLPGLLTFANGLFAALRMAGGMDRNLRVALLEFGTAIANDARMPAVTMCQARVMRSDFSPDDLLRLYRTCSFNHGIAVRSVFPKGTGVPPPSCSLHESVDYLEVMPGVSPLTEQWQLTQFARDELAGLDFSDRSGALDKALRHLPSLSFETVPADRWTQAMLERNDPGRAVAAELAAATAGTEMIEGMRWLVLSINEGGHSRGATREVAKRVGLMGKRARAAGSVWWHTFAHFELLDAMATLREAEGRFWRNGRRQRAMDLLRDARRIFIETNDVGMTARIEAFLLEIQEGGRTGVTAAQVNRLFFGR